MAEDFNLFARIIPDKKQLEKDYKKDVVEYTYVSEPTDYKKSN